MSQSYENRMLRWGSPMFHLGILMVIAGHVVGLLVPREWLYAIGISEEIYHVGAPYIVYRSRDEHRGSQSPKRGWDPVSAPDPARLRRR